MKFPHDEPKTSGQYKAEAKKAAFTRAKKRKDEGVKTVIKVVRMKANFSLMPDAFALDMTISHLSRSIWTALNARPESWETNVATLMRCFDIGRNKAEGVLLEMRLAGYAYGRKPRLESGHFGPMEYHISVCKTSLAAYVKENQWPENDAKPRKEVARKDGVNRTERNFKKAKPSKAETAADHAPIFGGMDRDHHAPENRGMDEQVDVNVHAPETHAPAAAHNKETRGTENESSSLRSEPTEASFHSASGAGASSEAQKDEVLGKGRHQSHTKADKPSNAGWRPFADGKLSAEDFPRADTPSSSSKKAARAKSPGGYRADVQDAEFEDVKVATCRRSADSVVEELTPIVDPTGTAVAVQKAAGAVSAPRPKKAQVALFQPDARSWAVWRALEKAFKNVRGAELVLVQGPRRTLEAFEAVEGWESFIPAVIAAIPAWKAQVLQMVASKRGQPCAASTWLSEGRWEALQPAEASEEAETVPEAFTALWEASKGLFDRTSSAGDALTVWSMLTQAERDIAKRALRFREKRLDGLTDEGYASDNEAERVTKMARREQAIRGVRFDQWLLKKDWIEHQAELDNEVIGFTSPRAALVNQIANYLDDLVECPGRDAETVEFHHRALHTQLGGLSIELLEQRVPAEIMVLARKRHDALVEERRQREVAKAQAEEARKVEIVENWRRSADGPSSDAVYRRLIDFMTGKRGDWEWGRGDGPRWNEPDCLIPADILAEARRRIDVANVKMGAMADLPF